VRLKESILLADVELDDDAAVSGALVTPAGEIKP
jgi:hypothetical protein